MQRITRQKTAVRALLNDLEGFHSAQQIHEMLAERGERVGLATVYRNLQQLADSGDVDMLRMGEENVFRACEPHHHHHIVCRNCGRTIPTDRREMSSSELSIACSNCADSASRSMVLRVSGSTVFSSRC